MGGAGPIARASGIQCGRHRCKFENIEADLYKLRRFLAPPSGHVPMSSVEWNFAEIEQSDPGQVARLTAVGNAKDLLSALEAELRTAIQKNTTRFGVDCHHGNPRAIVQFPVTPEVYDWFFNARTGYRAQFWEGPDVGDQYNRRILTTLREVLEGLPDQITARKIAVQIVGDSRDEIDEGPITISREKIFQSLDPQVAKIWICERVIQMDGGNPRRVPHSVIIPHRGSLFPMGKSCAPENRKCRRRTK
jgi:hypothetical protein